MKLKVRKWLLILIFQLSYVVPKKRGMIAFWPYQDERRFGGNIKPVFLEIIRRRGNASVTWITRDRDAASFLTGLGFCCAHGKFGILFALLRAQVIVLDTVYPVATGFPPFAWGKFHLVQLWHGTGFKEIGFRHVGAPITRREIIASKRQTVFIPATSEDDRVRKTLSFGTSNVFVTGNPRNDVFFSAKEKTEQTKRLIRASLGLPVDSRIILYAPTFRDHQQAEPFSEGFSETAGEILSKSNAYLVVKKHPLDFGFSPPAGSERIVNASDSVADTQDLLMASDILITDYSGIVTDFVLTGNPVVFYLYDLDDYEQSCRNFYYDFLDTIPGPIASSEEELLRLVSQTSWFLEVSYQKRYQDFVRRFHRFLDAGATDRVVAHILGYVDSGHR